MIFGSTRHQDVIVVWKGPVAHTHVVRPARRDLTNSRISLDVLKSGNGSRDGLTENSDLALLMHETDVQSVHLVLDELKPVARPVLLPRELEAARLLEHVLARQVELRRRAVPEIGEDDAAILPDRVAGNPNARGQLRALGRRLDALAAPVVFPAMIDAAHLVTFDPTRMQAGAAVRAPATDQKGLAAVTPIKGEILAQDAQRLRASGRDVARERNRLPELPQQIAHLRAAGGFDQPLKILSPSIGRLA